MIGEHRVGRGQGHAQGDGSAPARLVVCAPHERDDAPFGACGVTDRDAPAEGRGNQLGTQANAEHPDVCAYASAHELALGFQPREGLVVVDVRAPAEQNQGARQGSGGQVTEALWGLPGAQHLVIAEEGGELTRRDDRVVLNHEDAHTPIVGAITRRYLSALEESEQLALADRR